MEVVRVVALTPGDIARGLRLLVRHTMNAVLHKAITADGTLIDFTLPLPHGDGVPLLDDILLLSLRFH